MNDYGQFGSKHYKQIQKGLKLYNEGFYWECHEELEDHWLEDRADQATLVYWAVIQVATALYHYQNGNEVGAKSMMAKAKNKLERMRGKNIETSLLENLGWSDFVAKIDGFQADQNAEYFKNLKEFRFQLERE